MTAGYGSPTGHRRRRRGFTLVELLVSILIIGVTLVGVVQLYLAAIWTFQKSRYLSLATQSAQREMETVHQLSGSSYDTLVSTGTALVPACYPAGSYTALTNGSRGVSFGVPELPGGSGTVTIIQDPYGQGRAEDAKLARVNIAIIWQAPNKTQSTVSVTTFITAPPASGGGG